ncbi:DUF4492 domain-containing protein [Phocaeicola salanitronis]|nr:DUF4492 domain-containing protein [Phocaeicola salanitronis]
MIKTQMFLSIWKFYLDGFRSMTIGRTLWILILIKLFIMFVILKVFFFPDFLKGKTAEEKQNYVGNELIIRSANSLTK